MFPALLDKHPDVQLICVGPVIDLYGKFAALKLAKMMETYPGRVFSKPEFTALPPFIFSGAEFALIPSRDEPFGLVAVEFGRKGALGVGSRVGGLGQMPGWWYPIEVSFAICMPLRAYADFSITVNGSQASCATVQVGHRVSPGFLTRDQSAHAGSLLSPALPRGTMDRRLGDSAEPVYQSTPASGARLCPVLVTSRFWILHAYLAGVSHTNRSVHRSIE